MIMMLAIWLSVGFVGWLVWRAVKGKPIQVHLVMNGLAALTSICAIAFFMTMDIPTIAKVLTAIILGAVLIVIAARQQRRRQRYRHIWWPRRWAWVACHLPVLCPDTG